MAKSKSKKKKSEPESESKVEEERREEVREEKTKVEENVVDFEVVVSEPGVLKAIQPLKKHFDEVTIAVKDGVAKLVSLDTARVALVEMFLGSAEGVGSVLVDTEKLAKAVKSPGRNEVRLKATENKLIIKKGRTRRTITSRIGGEEYPDIEFRGVTAEIVMLASDLLKAINEVSDVSDNVEFIATKNMFMIKAVGDIDEAEVVMLPEDGISIDINAEGDVDVRSVYSAEYLQQLVKSIKEVCSEVTVIFETDNPVKFTCSGARYLLAPRA